MTRREPDDAIRAWFHEGPDKGPVRGLEDTLARLADVPARGRREIRMPVWFPLAAMLALLLAALLAFGAGFRIYRPDQLALTSPSVPPSAAPSAGTGTCRLEAPVGGIHGFLVGTGFAPDTDVTIDIDRADGTHLTLDHTYNVSMHTDRNGSFGVEIRPYYADIGHEVAVAHAGCDARLEIDIAAADLPPRCPDPADSSAPVVDGGAYRAAVAADRPIDWWSLDDTAKTAADRAGGDTGTYVGRTVHAARSALSDGGSTFFDFAFPDPVEIDLAHPVVLAGDFTIEFWTYMCEYTDFSEPILRFAGDIVRLDSGDGHLHFIAGIDDQAVADTAMPTGSWHHWALTRHGGELQLYLDGVPDGWGNNWADPISVTMIGRSIEGSFRGYLDEIALYDHALAPERIAAHAHP